MGEKEKLNIKQLLKTIYLNMYKNGVREISLNPNDLSLQISRIEKVFEKYNIGSDDLFVKTPVLETYDRYVDYLISIFLQEQLGYMNEKYDGIIIECTMYNVEKQLEGMREYTQIINECCNEMADYNLEEVQTEKMPKRVLKIN